MGFVRNWRADVPLRQLPMNSTRASQAACDRTRHLTCSWPERAKCRVNTSGNIIDPNDRIRASERLTSDTRHRIGGALSPLTSHPTYCLEPAMLVLPLRYRCLVRPNPTGLHVYEFSISPV
jgi:hypothetical protein